MRIVFSMEGGFAALPGLARPVSINVDALPPAERATLGALVEQSRFFRRAEEAAPAGVADARTYTVDIDAGAQHRTLRVCEPVADPRLRELIDAIRAQIRASRPRP